MEIQTIEEKDLELISNLFLSVFSEPPWNEYWESSWVYERLLWIYKSQGFHGYLAESNKRTIGAILGYFVPFQGKKGFEIKEFFVDFKYQGQGIGTKLLNQLESELRKNDYEFSILLTSKESYAESFYFKKGYEGNDKLILMRSKL
ncbi:MAG: GNAT family N-acetyltransferase [Cyanobacteria bacterium P01_A01_bin.84]